MALTDKQYDFVIMGSGMGGLACAYILLKEGYSVVVLEKNHQIGGNLQVFSRDKAILDTGVHYIGSLDEGENLNQFFKYFGILDKLKWKRMDEDGFDVIRFKDGSEYKYAQGIERFQESLIKDFSGEKEAIVTYCEKIKETVTKFPLFNLETLADASATSYDEELIQLNAYDFIASITQNERLRNVLGGNNPLYAGVKEKSPWYVHALIMYSYLTGSYRLEDGGSQIAIQMSKAIRAMGGEIHKRKEVVGANYKEDKTIKEIVLQTGETVKGKQFISNFHPSKTIDVFGESHFIKAYRKRIKNLENTSASFITHFVFHENTFEYINNNIYQYNEDDVWCGVDYKEESWPEGSFICTPPSSKNPKYADSIAVMTYMDVKDLKQWDQSFNTVTTKGERGEGYEGFKKGKEAKILKMLEGIFPDIRTKIKSTHSSTPLTYRDYIGDTDGSMYGILKDSQNPMKTLINPKTKVPNLYLTGQNLVLHGILGATIGAFVTCFYFVDRNTLIDKVKSAKN